MILYHFSENRYFELVPVTGARRHGAEDPRAVGKAVVWLTNSSERAPGVESRARFRHEVDVAKNDPCLFKDEPTEGLKGEWQSLFPGKADSVQEMETLYFYTKALPVRAVVCLEHA